MKRIGILYLPGRTDSSQLAKNIRDILRQRDIDVWQGSADDESGLRQVARDLDLLITLGGDGTIVRAVRAVASSRAPCKALSERRRGNSAGPPILGVNLGRLGFLAELEPSRVQEALPTLLDGKYIVEERMMLHVQLRRGGQMILDTDAVNDVVMARGLVSRMVHVSVEVDGHHVMTSMGDGIIVSTPTGSTAYCLSAGGPIVAPDLDCMIITPISAHLGIVNALVIPVAHKLCLCWVKGESAMLTVDGQVDVALEPGDELCSAASENTARFVRFGGDGYFYETVLRRLGWPDSPPVPQNQMT